MKDKLHLLIVEDSEKQIGLYKDSIDLFNSGSLDVEITPNFARDLKEGLQKIDTESFDAAIVDLKLIGDTKEISGEPIIVKIQNTSRFPIYVMSGRPGDLNPDLQEPRTFYKIYNRTGKTNKDLLNEIVEMFKRGITKIFRKNGLIDKKLQEIYWKHISDLVEKCGNELSDDRYGKVILRHATNYLYEYLQLDDDNNFEEYHIEEMYIFPSIRNKKHTGDILKLGERYYIILSPSCDMVCNKAEKVTLVEIEDLDIPDLNEQIKIIKDESSGSKKKDSAEKRIESLLSNKHFLKYHFLPPSSRFPGGFINFQKILSVETLQLESDSIVEGRITEKFLKDIISRFSTYYARQGQPNFDLKLTKEKILS
jgi:hypothetical protein